MSSANVQLLEDFVGFCEAKKINLQHESAQGGNVSFLNQANAADDSTSFRNDVTMYFGDQLPTNVVDELCNLVNDSTHGKCRSCKMPTESLILSVLQILSDAAQFGHASKENTAAPPVSDVNVNVNLSSSKGVVNSLVKDFPMHCSQQGTTRSGTGFSRSMKCSRIPIDETARPNNVKINSCTPIIDANVRAIATEKPVGSMLNAVNGARPQGSQQFIRGSVTRFEHPIHFSNNVHTLLPDKNSKEASDFLHVLQMNKQTLVLDTPLVMCQGNRMFHDFASMPVNAPMMNKKPRVGAAGNQMCNTGNHSLGKSCFGKDAVPQSTLLGGNPVRPVIVLSDDSTKSGDNRYKIGPGQRFPITEQDVRYYNVICGLAHSQWSGRKAVEFSVLTSVTYCSLGESVEPGGKCDNFFVAGMCRYFFEHVHPRQSKKHFFYPKVVGSLYTYNCPDDIRIVQKSFIGANSAYKLNSSHKLVFPVVIGKHWFVFIVDLENKLYVFLDSFFNENANFQIEARTRLINAFKECWYQYAEGCMSLDAFTFSYPEVPK